MFFFYYPYKPLKINAVLSYEHYKLYFDMILNELMIFEGDFQNKNNILWHG